MPVTNLKAKWESGDLVFSGTGVIDFTASEVMLNFKAGAASSVDPSATAEDGWINIEVDGTTRYIPWYNAT